jgi:hypothetical protein
MRLKGLLVVVPVAVSLALAGVALAAKADTDTTFKMKAKSPTKVEYSGKVTSDPDRRKCVKGRVVTIIHNGVEIAETETDEDGKWSVKGPRPPSGDVVTAYVHPEPGRKGCKDVEVSKRFKPN